MPPRDAPSSESFVTNTKVLEGMPAFLIQSDVNNALQTSSVTAAASCFPLAAPSAEKVFEEASPDVPSRLFCSPLSHIFLSSAVVPCWRSVKESH